MMHKKIIVREFKSDVDNVCTSQPVGGTLILGSLFCFTGQQPVWQHIVKIIKNNTTDKTIRLHFK